MLDGYALNIALAFGAFAVGMLSPGPNVMVVLATSMGTSRNAGSWVAAGVGAGSGVWALAALCGLTAMLQLYASLMVALKVAGALYLFWLAYKSLRAALTPGGLHLRSADPASGHAYFRRGVIVCLANPKAVLTYVAIMAIAMDGDAPLWVGTVVAIGTTVISLLGHLIYARLFSTRPLVSAYGRFRRWIDGVLGLVFAAAGAKLLASRG